jgi:lipoprotein signal peptidase
MPRSGGWWPTFNVADSCVCIAASLLFISGFLEEKALKAKKKAVG